jgi:hypothetical protein
MPLMEDIRWSDLDGSLLLFTVHAIENGIVTVHGEAQAARVDVVVLDGAHAGRRYEDVRVFPKVLISQVKPSLGGMVMGRLGQGTAKPGQHAPWLLEEATDADKDVARAHLARNAGTPF